MNAYNLIDFNAYLMYTDKFDIKQKSEICVEIKIIYIYIYIYIYNNNLDKLKWIIVKIAKVRLEKITF